MSDEIDPALIQEIGGMFERLQELNKISLAQLEPQVDYVIRNHITDNNQVEHLLDSLIDCAGMSEEGLLVFKRLCRYYFPIDPNTTAEYILLYRELYDSDDGDEDADTT